MTRWYTIAKTQERDDGGLDQGDSRGGGEEKQDSGYILNGMLTGFADGCMWAIKIIKESRIISRFWA